MHSKTALHLVFYSLQIFSLFCRIGKVGTQKRVVGVLLGSWHKKVLDVSNSFAGMFAVLGAKCTSFQLKYVTLSVKTQLKSYLFLLRFHPSYGKEHSVKVSPLYL